MSILATKIKAMVTLVVFVLPYLDSSLVLAAGNGAKRARHADFTLKRGGEIDSRDQKLDADLLKAIPDFDDRHNAILAIVRWQGPSGPRAILVVQEGQGRVTDCSIFERVGETGFDSVTGGAFCRFLTPVGEFNKNSDSVKFKGKIRQGYDSYETNISFELFYDEKLGIFCDPLSQSDRFKCRAGVGATQQ
jgi:hypothetical protein